jgi:uncharacterized membrane protein
MMIHPATAHFAMVLPLVASVFSLIYIVNKSETFSKIAARTTLFAALAMIGVWYTGTQAGPQIYDYLSEAGQETLVAHKNLGLYLAIAMGVIALFQIAGCKLKKPILQTIATVALIGATLATFAQGKKGGELVYNYGTPFKSYMIMDSLVEAVATAEEEEEESAKIEAYEDAIEDINMLSEEVDAMYGNPVVVQSNEEIEEE